MFLAKEGMKLDLGCISPDKIADYLKSQHVTSHSSTLAVAIKTIGDNVLAGRP